MRKKRFYFLAIVIITFLTIGYLALKPAFNYLSGFLSKSAQVKANILIVEGWLPDYALDIAYDEYQKNKYDYIITTGIKYSPEYVNLSENGYLIFYTKFKGTDDTEIRQHTIEVDATGSLNGEYSAHFSFYVNGSIIDGFTVDRQKQRFSSKWKGSLSQIDSVMVQFNNDRIDEKGDVNLFIKDIIIDHKFTIPYLNNSEYDKGYLDGKRRLVNNSISSAQSAKKWFLEKGIDSSAVISVTGERVKVNRTLTGALAFRDWVKKSDINIKGINIISLGTHARRTWMTYNKILNEKYEIGIISLPDYKNSSSRENKALKTLRETLGIIYYWIILKIY
jgi:hypothetical protein